MAKKRTQLPKYKLLPRVLTIGVALFAVLALGVLGYNSFVRHSMNAREARILDIYSSIKLDDSYIQQTSDVFGDKRVYDYDKGRTFSSSQTFVRGDTVDHTIADLKTKIAAAGFTLFDEPYGGGQQHFKSAKNEYVRVTVSSKLRDDAFQNAILMKQPIDEAAVMDRNLGPVNVTIKVNLDDNNE